MNKKLLLDNGFQPLDKTKYKLYTENSTESRVLDIRFPILQAYWDDALYRIHDSVMLTAVNEQDGYIFLPAKDFKAGIKQMLKITSNISMGYMTSEQAEACPLPTYRDKRFSDYIVSRNELIVTSWKYKHKTADYNRFMKNSNISVKPFCANTADDCRTILNNWCKGRNCADCLFGCEKGVLEKYIDLTDCGITGLVVYCGGAPIGNLIAYAQGDTLYYPYAKADNSYFGISVYMYIDLAKKFDTQYVNLGSDGGIEGIRHFKGKFRPYILTDKYFTY